MRCENCGYELRETDKGCAACELYNAAVEAQEAAAASLARDRANGRKIGRTWVNEYGFFAAYDGVHDQIGTVAEAAPFAELTTNAIRALDRPKPPTVVCLCGSTRFYEAFRQAEYDEEQKGNIVLSIGFKPDIGPGEHGQNVGITPERKTEVDELHNRKIDLSNEILILNVGGYLGDSTRRELDYARRHGKDVRWLEPPRAGGGSREAPHGS